MLTIQSIGHLHSYVHKGRLAVHTIQYGVEKFTELHGIIVLTDIGDFLGDHVIGMSII